MTTGHPDNVLAKVPYVGFPSPHSQKTSTAGHSNPLIY